jgi:hypothetical protein
MYFSGHDHIAEHLTYNGVDYFVAGGGALTGDAEGSSNAKVDKSKSKLIIIFLLFFSGLCHYYCSSVCSLSVCLFFSILFNVMRYA